MDQHPRAGGRGGVAPGIFSGARAVTRPGGMSWDASIPINISTIRRRFLSDLSWTAPFCASLAGSADHRPDLLADLQASQRTPTTIAATNTNAAHAAKRLTLRTSVMLWPPAVFRPVNNKLPRRTGKRKRCCGAARFGTACQKRRPSVCHIKQNGRVSQVRRLRKLQGCRMREQGIFERRPFFRQGPAGGAAGRRAERNGGVSVRCLSDV